MEFEASGFQRRPAIVREGTAHGRTGPPDDRGYRASRLSNSFLFHGARSANLLLEPLFRMLVRLVDGVFRSFIQVTEVTVLVRHLGSSTCHGAPNGEFVIGDDPCNGHARTAGGPL